MVPTFGRAAAAAVLLSAVQAGAVAQERATALYACGGDARAESAVVGVTLCNGEPTPALLERAEADNLQVRQGGLVTAVAADGVAGTAGLQAGDMLYRVGGADVTDAETATDRLGRVAARADTVVNFLRGGRPYLVKLRRQ